MRVTQLKKIVLAAAVGLLTWPQVASADEDRRSPEEKRGDARIEARLDGDIQKDTRLARKVEAVVNRGKATLVGTVATETDRVRAEQLARTSGASAVDNQVAVIEVPAPSATQVADQPRALSDPHRKDPLVGTMPNESAVREMRFRTLGMEDPKLQKQREQQKQQELQEQRELQERQQQRQPPAPATP